MECEYFGKESEESEYPGTSQHDEHEGTTPEIREHLCPVQLTENKMGNVRTLIQLDLDNRFTVPRFTEMINFPDIGYQSKTLSPGNPGKLGSNCI